MFNSSLKRNVTLYFILRFCLMMKRAIIDDIITYIKESEMRSKYG